MAEKTLLETKVEEHIGEFQLLFAQADTQLKGIIEGMLKDSKELLETYVDLSMVANDLIEILDKYTNTGIADAVDGPALKTFVNWFLINKKSEEWYDKMRLDLIAKIDNAGK